MNHHFDAPVFHFAVSRCIRTKWPRVTQPARRDSLRLQARPPGHLSPRWPGPGERVSRRSRLIAVAVHFDHEHPVAAPPSSPHAPGLPPRGFNRRSPEIRILQRDHQPSPRVERLQRTSPLRQQPAPQNAICASSSRPAVIEGRILYHRCPRRWRRRRRGCCSRRRLLLQLPVLISSPFPAHSSPPQRFA